METGGFLNAALLWLTGKLAEHPWVTAGVAFALGMLAGFAMWAIGVR